MKLLRKFSREVLGTLSISCGALASWELVWYIGSPIFIVGIVIGLNLIQNNDAVHAKSEGDKNE